MSCFDKKKSLKRKKITKTLVDSKIRCTFASLFKRSTLPKEFWRDGRVVDCGGLENRCTARYRGFESLSLRQKSCKSSTCNSFFIYSKRLNENS